MTIDLNLTLPADPSSVARARVAVQDALGQARPEVCEDVRLLVSELVTNSVRHSGLSPDAHVALRVEATPETVRVEVEDTGRGFDPQTVSGPRGIGGWGLYLVERLAARWGVRGNGRTAVWFELDRPFETARA